MLVLTDASSQGERLQCWCSSSRVDVHKAKVAKEKLSCKGADDGVKIMTQNGPVVKDGSQRYLLKRVIVCEQVDAMLLQVPSPRD